MDGPSAETVVERGDAVGDGRGTDAAIEPRRDAAGQAWEAVGEEGVDAAIEPIRDAAVEARDTVGEADTDTATQPIRDTAVEARDAVGEKDMDTTTQPSNDTTDDQLRDTVGEQDADSPTQRSKDTAAEPHTDAAVVDDDEEPAPTIEIPLDDAPPPITPLPPAPATPLTPARVGFIPLVSVVGFHHARGPEVESWFGADEGGDPAADFGWHLLPFMALSDGAHASEEDFSYFTLLRPETPTSPATSLFGISCTRQLDATKLLNRPADVTRSTVQKAVVVIADSPQAFGMLRERLGIVTQAWFAQREFTDVDILKGFQESLADEKRRGLMGREGDADANLGMSLRELVHEFRWQTLVLLKSCLLQRKMLFFGSRCDRLCMIQFSLISLIPNLIRNLQDCADPELCEYEKNLKPPTSLRTSDRNSLLQYMGLPLQIFGKGSLFGPYTPLQQLDVLADFGTKSYIVGSTNSLLLQQRDRYSDILVNLDDNTVSISSPSLRSALALTASDRRWIDYLAQEVSETWDDADPGRPKTMRYVGSEEFIRLQFEEYILSLIAAVKYHDYITPGGKGAADVILLPHVEGDPSLDFGAEWIEAWKTTENHRIWNANTDSHLFDIVDPKHPCAGGLTMEDVQRRIADQVKELHLDERFALGKEVLGRNLAFGREKAGTVFNKIYADMESFREAQRRRTEEAAARGAAGARASSSSSASTPTLANYPHHATNPSGDPLSPTGSFAGVDLSKAGQTVSSVGARAGAYVSSWASWAGEKRKTGFGAGWGAAAASSSSGGKGAAAREAGAGSPEAAAQGGGYRSVGARTSVGSAGSYELRSEDEGAGGGTGAEIGEGFVDLGRAGKTAP